MASQLELFPEYADEDNEHCPRCGALWAWDGDTEASRVCGACRSEDAMRYEAREDERRREIEEYERFYDNYFANSEERALGGQDVA